MKIKFIGAVGGDVTGSCILCCARNGTRFLVDCGKFQGGWLTDTKNARFPFDPKTIDFVLLTHAHADHCGRIPDLYRQGFAGKVICNSATRDLAILNFMDDLSREGDMVDWDSERELWQSRFFTEEQRPEIGLSKRLFIDNDLHITMLRSSHFLGAVSFSVAWNVYREDGDPEGKYMSKTICFGGDLGSVIDGEKNHLPLLKEGMSPFPNTNYIVMESTYGVQTRNSECKNFDERINRLRKLISTPDVDNFVFACFSMQRTQDVLFDLLYAAMQDKERRYSIVLDSNMGIRACEIYKKILLKTAGRGDEEKFLHLDKNFMARFLPLLGDDYAHQDSEENKDIAATKKFIESVLSANFEHGNVAVAFKQPKNYDATKKIRITSSGMFHAGAVLEHVKNKHDDARTAFVITGYCRSTKNGKIIFAWGEDTEDAEDANETLFLGRDGEEGKIITRKDWKANICNIASYYSGHADAEGLLRFLFHSTMSEKPSFKVTPDLPATTVFLNHGDAAARAGLKKKIEEDGKKPENQKLRKIKSVILPNATDPFFDLDKGEWDASSNDLLFPAFVASAKKRAAPPVASPASPKFFRIVGGNFIATEAGNRAEENQPAKPQNFAPKKAAKERPQFRQYPAPQNMEGVKKILREAYIQCPKDDEEGWILFAKLGAFIKKVCPDLDPQNYGHGKLGMLARATDIFQLDDSNEDALKVKIKDRQ